jgi:Fe2+ transport system protein B
LINVARRVGRPNLEWTPAMESRIVELVLTSRNKHTAFKQAAHELGRSQQTIKTRYNRNIKGKEAELIKAIEQPKRQKIKIAKTNKELESNTIKKHDLFVREVLVVRFTDMYGNQHSNHGGAVRSNIEHIKQALVKQTKDTVHEWVQTNKDLIDYLINTKPQTK